MKNKNYLSKIAVQYNPSLLFERRSHDRNRSRALSRNGRRCRSYLSMLLTFIRCPLTPRPCPLTPTYDFTGLLPILTFSCHYDIVFSTIFDVSIFVVAQFIGRLLTAFLYHLF